jgi:hypothetical protein
VYGESPTVRAAAILALASLNKEEADEREEVFKKLTSLLEDKALRVRVAAIKALGTLGDARAIPALHAMDEREAIHLVKSSARGVIRALKEKAGKGTLHGKKEK